MEPKVSPEKFTLYDFKFCPYCQRVRYTLDYHQIPYDRVMVNLISKPDWYYRLHPDGKVPLLRFQDERLIESDLVMLYVDQFNGKPETSLLNVCGEEAFKEALALSAAVGVIKGDKRMNGSSFFIGSDSVQMAYCNCSLPVPNPRLPLGLLEC
ncbi:unnamed protein product [Mesocestoides corti]|uniref:GST N-terminal domain-containing protein n=1 Tax=Mesocestoides corti TaxID=53468 RepID=A0A3P6GM57_MESCO|nr:unnamed protein product [Mesocestoides corti]